MKKIQTLVFAVLFGFAFNAAAQIKVDAGDVGGTAVDIVGGVSLDASKIIDPVAEKYQTIKKGLKGAIESSEKIQKAKEKYEELKKKREAIQQRINDMKAKVARAKKLVDDAKSTVNNAIGVVKGVADDANKAIKKAEEYKQKAENLKKQAEAVAKLKASKEELSNLETQQKAFVDEQNQSLDAQIKVLNDNNETLEQMGEEEDEQFRKIQIKQNKGSIETLEKQKSDIKTSERYQDFENQKKALQKDVQEKEKLVEQITNKLAAKGSKLADKAAGKATAAVDSLLSGQSKEYDAISSKFFIPANEVEGGEILSQVIKERKKEAGKATLKAYATAMRIKSNLEVNQKALDDLKEDVAGTDSQTGALLIETSGTRVQIMHALLDYIKLMSAELKMLTANDLMNLPLRYEHKKEFNFDDYVFTSDDAKGIKKSKGLSISGIKSTISDTKNTISQTKDNINAAKDFVGTAKDTLSSGEGVTSAITSGF